MVYEGIVFKNDKEYVHFIDKTNGDDTFFRTINNTTIKYLNNRIEYIDTTLSNLRVAPLKIDLTRNTNYG